jgi:hypothetical protein
MEPRSLTQDLTLGPSHREQRCHWWCRAQTRCRYRCATLELPRGSHLRVITAAPVTANVTDKEVKGTKDGKSKASRHNGRQGTKASNKTKVQRSNDLTLAMGVSGRCCCARSLVRRSCLIRRALVRNETGPNEEGSCCLRSLGSVETIIIVSQLLGDGRSWETSYSVRCRGSVPFR